MPMTAAPTPTRRQQRRPNRAAPAVPARLDRARSTTISTPASGTRLGRIAIATPIASPPASGRRATVSSSASVHAAVTGTSLIAFIS